VATLSIRGVHKRYGRVQALRELNMEVADGELLVLVGPSGCGKSTALRVTAGLEDVSAGSVHIGGRDVTRLAPAERNVAMVFQSYALFPHMTVAANIGIGLKVRRVPSREAGERIRAAAALVGCEAQLDRRPHQLSGGERQRVALARAMVREPDVFLLDEPLSNLDAQLRVQTRAELQRLHQRLGATMLYVTHDQIEALTMGDRVAVLRGGVLQQLAPPDEIYRRPANRFVASFIGSPAMNLLPVSASGQLLQVGPFLLERPPGSQALNGQRLELGIRPEHLRVSLGGPGVPAEVQVVELAGSETFLHLAVGGKRLVARVGLQLRPRVGEQVWVQIPERRVYLFDAVSGRTLVQAT
jgi:sn-glycerol 3-phosphate transport system ATP-binding protein